MEYAKTKAMYKKPETVKFIISSQSEMIKKEIKTCLLKNKGYVIMRHRFFLRKTKLFPPKIRFDFLIIHCERICITDIIIIKNIKQKNKDINILLITGNSSLKHISPLCSAGVDGFLDIKEIHKLQEAIETILAGKRYMNPILSNCLLQNMLAKGSDTYDDHLTILNLEEHQVFQLIHAGYSENYITEILGISPEEVRTYKNQLNNKIEKIYQCRK